MITTIDESGNAHVRETGETVANQRLPRGWSLQWVLQADDSARTALDDVPDLAWISKSVTRTSGVAEARTTALQRADGVLTRVLDADELFPDVATVARDIEVLEANRDLGWVLAPVLIRGRQLAGGSSTLPSGRLPSNSLLELLRDGTPPYPCMNATIHTDLVVAHGGWPDLPSAESIGLLVACEAVSDGWMQEEPGAVCRRHAEPPAIAPVKELEDEREAAIQVALSRAEALRQLGWRWQPS
ncbi:GltA [Streptomyces sp. SID4956]|uniref:GltA n=1 Tax=Streptomyces sp. SID4956 TaxID=2690290 RepID=UPI0031FBB218